MSGKLVPEPNEVTQLYWDGTAEGELRVKHCPTCEALFRFNHAWCPECGNAELDWKKTAGRGVVTNFTIIHVPPYEATWPPPSRAQPRRALRTAMPAFSGNREFLGSMSLARSVVAPTVCRTPPPGNRLTICAPYNNS